MLTKEEIISIRNLLESSQNPLFFFDNDVDGFCSFIILQKSLSRGKGVAIKSFPELDKNYLRKIDELNPDHVFILDKAKVSNEFIEGVIEMGLPLTWIDHHESEISRTTKEKIEYFNSFPSSEPTTYLAHKIFNKKTDIWITIIGCIGDNFMPEFINEYGEENPEILQTTQSPFDCLYKTEIGKISTMINFGLKDTTTNVLKMIKLFIKAKNPSDILDENSETKHLHQRYEHLSKHMDTLIKKTRAIGDNLMLLEYAGETSMSSELANKLQFENPKKHILVIYKKLDSCNISIRGKDAKKILLESIENIFGATGGGHKEACGARVPAGSLEEFKTNFIKTINQ